MDNSLQRDTVKLEHLRMRVAHEPITNDLIDMELIELKFIFDRGQLCISALFFLVIHHHFVAHSDNRDFEIIPNYQPKTSQDLNELTLLFGKPEGVCCIRLSFFYLLISSCIRANGCRVS